MTAKKSTREIFLGVEEIRMSVKTLIVALLLSLLSGFFLFAEVEIEAKIDRKTVPINESATLTVSIYGGGRGGGSRPNIPSVDGFRIHGSGTSSNISIINGQMTAYSTYQYTLVPKEMGKFRIPSISVVQDGKEYKTKPIDVEVVKATEVRVSRSSGTLNVPEEAGKLSEEEQSQGVVFVTASVDRKTAYIDEQITYTFRFYRKVNLLKSPEFSAPSTQGFWVEDLPPVRPYYQYDKNNERYLVSEVKMALFPTATGELTIGPAQLECIVPGPRKSTKRRDIFSLFDEDPFSVFGSDPFGRFNGKRLQLKTEPVHVTVLPLPQDGKPEGFTGMVGSFRFDVSIEPREVEVNQPITLKIDISGQGNLKTLPEPDFSHLKDFKIYDSGDSVDITKNDFIIGGRKVIEKVLIPQEAGTREIPGLTFSYFDPFQRKYKEITSKPVTITVVPSTQEKTPVLTYAPSSSQQDITVLKSDINHIHTTTAGFVKKHTHVLAVVASSNAIPLVLFLFLCGLRLNVVRQEKNVDYFRTKKAHGFAKKKLSEARRLLKTDDKETFYQALAVALRQYLADKSGLSAAGLRFSQIEEKIQKLSNDDALLDDVRRCMEGADMIRFSSIATDADQMKNDLVLAENVIVRLEKLKWNGK